MVELQIIVTVLAVAIQTKLSIGETFTIEFQALRSSTITWLSSPALYSSGLDRFLVPTEIRGWSRSENRLGRLNNTNTGCIPVMRNLEVLYINPYQQCEHELVRSWPVSLLQTHNCTWGSRLLSVSLQISGWGRVSCPLSGVVAYQNRGKLSKQDVWTSVKSKIHLPCHFEDYHGRLSPQDPFLGKFISIRGGTRDIWNIEGELVIQVEQKSAHQSSCRDPVPDERLTFICLLSSWLWNALEICP